MVGVLSKRLVRELYRARGQAFAIAAVIASGIALFVVLRSTMDSLDLSLEAWYGRSRFAEVFATAVRAPRTLEAEIAALPGVAAIEARVAAGVLAEVPGLDEPATVRLQSIPDRGATPLLNDVLLRSGRRPEPGRDNEVLISEGFANANTLSPGDSLVALINGRRRSLQIVGLGLSPEYTYTVRPGEMMPDERRFGIVWMERRALASAFRMEGGFNDLALSLSPGAVEEEVIARIDHLLAPYGGTGAIPRARQLSHWFLANEIEQLKGSAKVIPVIFLGVAAFLLNVVLSRMVHVDRGQIAAMKAMGRSDTELALHTLSWALAVALVGAAIGIVAGVFLGRGMTQLYLDLFHIPLLEYRLRPVIAIQAVAVALLAAAAGALGAARAVLKLAPAEAMRPEAPASYRESWPERLGLKRYLPQTSRMVLRHLGRHPGRTAVSVFGIAAGGALLVVGLFSLDAVEELLDTQFGQSHRWDQSVTFAEPRGPSALHELSRMPGVLRVEPQRTVAGRLTAGQREHLAGVIGLPRGSSLTRAVDRYVGEVPLPAAGIVLSAKLAEILAVGPGDTLILEVLEGRRPRLEVRVAGLVDTLMGAEAWMEIGALRSLLGEGDVVSAASLLVDRNAEPALYRTLEATPSVAGVAIKRAAIQSFRDTLGENVGLIRNLNVFFASIIAFGVVYNAARISLAERERELATLRVIGFTRAEISSILLGELALITLVAAPLGAALGTGLAWWVVETIGDTELYRLPFVVSLRTMAVSVGSVMIAAVISGLVVRRRLDRLDLIAVLKNRE